MKTIKLIFLLLGTLFYTNISAQKPIDPTTNLGCFSMEIVDASYSPPGQSCFDITVTLGPGMGSNQGVVIYDGIHPPVKCFTTCTIQWCYDSAVTVQHTETVYCQALEGPCDQLDGCIVIVD